MRVLIVDDDPSVVNFFSQAAEARGHTEVDTAYDGQEALGRVVQNTYDLITLDLRMPGVSGIEILSPVRDMSPHAIIAVISAYVSEEGAPDLAGCADVVLHKPVRLEVFNGLLDGASRIHETMKEIRHLGDASSGVT